MMDGQKCSDRVRDTNATRTATSKDPHSALRHPDRALTCNHLQERIFDVSDNPGGLNWSMQHHLILDSGHLNV